MSPSPGTVILAVLLVVVVGALLVFVVSAVGGPGADLTRERDQLDRALRQVRELGPEVRRHRDLVEQRTALVQRELSRARRTADFRHLCQLHWESVQAGNVAFAYYADAKKTMHTVRDLHRDAAKARDRFKAERRGLRGAPRGKVHAAVTANAAAARQLAGARTVMDAEIAKGLGLVRDLNDRTRHLKVAIRDTCGERGRRWCAELENRTAARRADRRQLRG